MGIPVLRGSGLEGFYCTCILSNQENEQNDRKVKKKGVNKRES